MTTPTITALPEGYTPSHNGLYRKACEFGREVEILWRDSTGRLKFVEHLTPEMFKQREKNDNKALPVL